MKKVLMLSIVLIIALSSNAMRIRMKGSGGVVSSGGKTQVCPSKSNDVCAIVDGNWWDIIKYWWKNQAFGQPLDIQDGSITYVDEQGRTITYSHVNLQIKSAESLIFNEELNEATISNFDIYIVE
jgi:hypothetical protein